MGIKKKKLDEDGKVVRKKSRLVNKGYSQWKGIYYKETYASVARLQAIWLLLTFDAHSNEKLYQIDVKKCIFEWIHPRGSLCRTVN